MQIPNRIPGLIQVLWIEDDPVLTKSLPIQAENLDIQLVSFPCWDDAKVALKSQFKRWEAVVLDAKCKVHPDSHDNAVQFLGNVLLGLSDICMKEHRELPWYVLTGGSEGEVRDSIPESRLQWDGDWDKGYYEKSVDTDILFRRIRSRVRRAPAMFVQERYQKVFDAIEHCGLGDDAYNALEELLVQIHYSEQKDEDFNNKFKNVRIIYESLFRAMIRKGLLPEQKRINSSWSSMILSGKDVYNRKKELVVRSNYAILPKIIENNLKEMIFVVGSYLHTESSDDENTQNTTTYLQQVDSDFLLKSYALQLCDIILWYDKYIQVHDDEEINALNWDLVGKI